MMNTCANSSWTERRIGQRPVTATVLFIAQVLTKIQLNSRLAGDGLAGGHTNVLCNCSESRKQLATEKQWEDIFDKVLGVLLIKTTGTSIPFTKALPEVNEGVKIFWGAMFKNLIIH